MLEVRNLLKTYRPKRGVPVEAVSDVSIKLPKSGMVFLLGKSGSGKSTMLNLMGGLDRYDGGDLIIKGVSSKEFKQSDFDSYRNTYVGFIFQEYNLLNEFSVGANVALAIELQGRKATNEEVNAILREVDLDGYGIRRPSELSGGQKQRVAIARALVKNPEIIMADEPTGALDSATGRQVLDTLKRLSATKLVLVVSHDRDFAEQYADRIIELADGKIISDTSYENAPADSAPAMQFSGSHISVPKGYVITEDDRIKINEYIAKLASGGELELNGSNFSRKASPTDESKIVLEENEKFKPIKSKLPMKAAFKLGASGLKHKKFRLVMTVLLSCVAFILFTLSDTFSSYNHIRTCAQSIMDSNLRNLSVEKTVRHGDFFGRSKMSEGDMKDFFDKTGVELTGVYMIDSSKHDISLGNHIDRTVKYSETDYTIYPTFFSGFAELNESELNDLGYRLLAGRMPALGQHEVAITALELETFKIGGYSEDASVKDAAFEKITSAEDILGKTLSMGDDGEKYTIVGVIDTNFDIERFRPLIKEDLDADEADLLIDYVLMTECRYARDFSHAAALILPRGGVQLLIDELPPVTFVNDAYVGYTWGDSLYGWAEYMGMLSDIPSDEIVWLSGEKTTLAADEIIISAYYAMTNIGAKSIDEMIENIRSNPKVDVSIYSSVDDGTNEDKVYKVVGVTTNPHVMYNYAMIVPDELFNRYCEKTDEIFDFAVGLMPSDRGEIEELVTFCYDESGDVHYEIQSAVTYELELLDSTITILADVFVYVGLAFAIFAALMFANFIATSISYKKHEIGILRAIGSRGADVFRIFFSESFIIAMINFVISLVGSIVVISLINRGFRADIGILVTVLTFGVRQVLLLFALCLAVAAAASFLPVRRIAAMRPIDAIRKTS